MADTKTVNDWTTVRNEAESQLRALEAQAAGKIKIIASTGGKGIVGETAIIALQNIQGKIAKTQEVILNADKQIELATDSPRGTIANPTTSSNPAPASNQPGNNTDLLPIDDPTFGPNTLNPEFITDPFTQTATGAENQREIDSLTNRFPPPVQETDPEIARQLAAAQAAAGDTGEISDGGDNQTPVAAGTQEARSSGNEGRYIPFPTAKDYRVRISLAPSADYLYKDPDIQQDHGNILWPLINTDGVIYPYTPQISVGYSANYSPTDLTHSNYKIYNYTGSAVDNIQITGDFTAQDVVEANYVLAVMHFFKCVTKMFYGLDQQAGVPPPLVYLSGHGQYGFDNHPMVVTNFTLSYPTDCDYINAGPYRNVAAVFNGYKPPSFSYNPKQVRLYNSKLQPGGLQAPPTFGVPTNSRDDVTRIPTKIQIQISAQPIVTRYNISNAFSLKEYATGKLLRGSQNKSGGGIW